MSCANAYDTIAQSSGTVINHFDYPDPEHTVTSYCRMGDGMWVAWINAGFGANLDVGTGDQTKTDWPSEIASANAIGVGYFPDDGSTPIVYELGIDPCFDWDSGTLYAGRDPCSHYPFVGDKYSNNVEAILAGWFSGLLDVQIRTDGANVWVVALARESVKYPFLYNSPTEIDDCGNTHQTFEEIWAGGDSDAFFHDTDTGNRFWVYFSGGVGGGDKPFGDYDDPGPSNSLRWQPARVTVFAGDIGGFTKIDTVEAKFNNYDTGLVGGIDCAASPAEPGVLHVLWSEGGDFGVQTVQPKRGQRLNYSRWNSTAKTLDTDLLYKDENGSGTISDANWVWTADYVLRNDHGSPIAIVWPWITNGGPVYLGPGEFWDLSSGSAETTQTLDTTLYPTRAEIAPPDSGDVVPAGSLKPDAFGLPTFGYAPRSLRASSLYTDPLKAGESVYLLRVMFATSNGSFQVAADNSAFYRIAADGSSTFEFLDGIREVMYSIIPGNTGFNFASDFVSETDNVWVPNLLRTINGAVWQLDRQCVRGWTLLPAFPITDAPHAYEDGAFAVATSPPSLVTDGGGDWLYGGGYGPQLTTSTTSPTNIAAVKAKICRCCQPCNRTGMHVWETL